MNRISRRAACALLALAGAARAMGRTPQGGVLRMSVPLSLRELDPHVLDDPAAALFGAAIADSLYALDASGRPYPTLAAALPEPSPKGALVRLRPGLVSASGKPIDARDAAFSLARARGLAALGLLSPFAEPKVVGQRSALEFAGARADDPRLVAALASPVTAIVPRGFSRLAPDGTGAFAATPRRDGLTLRRNPRAARGASFLDRVEIAAARSLAEALRAFEAGLADVGWLGAGLHRSRAGSKSLSGPIYGHVILRTGSEAKAWGAAGLAQRLADGARPEQLGHLGVVPEPGAVERLAWGGGPAELLVAGDAPQLEQIAQALAAALSQPGNEVRERSLPRPEFEQRRSAGRFALMLDFVRPIGPKETLLLALLTAANPALARRPPRIEGQRARDLTRTLPLGLVGSLQVTGAVMPEFHGLESWQLGSVYRDKPKT